jgi:hypothetical protein
MKNILRRLKKRGETTNEELKEPEDNVVNNQADNNVINNNNEVVSNLPEENKNLNPENGIDVAHVENNLNDINNVNNQDNQENKDNITNNVNNNNIVINPAEEKKVIPALPEKKENKIQTEFKNIFQGKDFFSNNTYRKRLMHLTFACILVDMIILEILW